MIGERTLVDSNGHCWTVEYRESQRLTHIGGFLVTCEREGCITLNAQLSEGDKARGRELMLHRLIAGKVGERSIYLWHPEDE